MTAPDHRRLFGLLWRTTYDHPVSRRQRLGRSDRVLQNAFGATELKRIMHPNGSVGHAEIKIGDSIVMMVGKVEWFPSPQMLGGASVAIKHYVEDVDAVAEQAVASGATVLRDVKDQFYGDRVGTLRDPFGHLWFISTRTEDLSQDEMQERATAETGAWE